MKILFFTCLLFFHANSCLHGLDKILEVPVSYQGRILPAESYARQWVYNLSHQTDIREKNVFDLLWDLHFNGYQNVSRLPLFWIQLKAAGQLFGLGAERQRYSYQELNDAYSNPSTKLNILKELISYHFSKAFLSQENRAGRTSIELRELVPGLRVQWLEGRLIIKSTPQSDPWLVLQEGMILAESVSLKTFEAIFANRPVAEEVERVLAELLKFERLRGREMIQERYYDNYFDKLTAEGLPPKDIGLQLEQKYPFVTRLENAGGLLRVLPGKPKSGEWYSLNALHLKVYNPSRQTLELSKNFTIYPDSLFEKIRRIYFELESAVESGQDKIKINLLKEQLAEFLIEGYKKIEKTPHTSALGKAIYYPSLFKTRLEGFYSRYPLLSVCIYGYALALAILLLATFLNSSRLSSSALLLLLVAFGAHTALLFLRSYILERPPVANMLETILYVPWVGVLFSLCLRYFYNSPFPLIASSAGALILLILLQANFYPSSLENVQAVLDSRYWLMIHVLMVVGSYGLFLLSSLLGHFYLVGLRYYKTETASLKMTSKCLLQILYVGVALLIAGTLLGGVWAAESWGRFWDWDPKESWAFISICVYLLFIHAYRFGKIQRFGLALGAVSGFLAISFTWYGVNYILGTGLHSYGFGSGGNYYYYSFLFFEMIFLSSMIQSYNPTKDIDKKTTNC